jgi:hypothetical protein
MPELQVNDDTMMRVRNYVCAKFNGLQVALQDRFQAFNMTQMEMKLAVDAQRIQVADLQHGVSAMQDTIARLLTAHKAFWDWEEKFSAHVTAVEVLHKSSLRTVNQRLQHFARAHQVEESKVLSKLCELEQRLGTLEGLLLPPHSGKPPCQQILFPEHHCFSGEPHSVSKPFERSAALPTPIVQELQAVAGKDSSVLGSIKTITNPGHAAPSDDEWEEESEGEPRRSRVTLCDDKAGAKPAPWAPRRTGSISEESERTGEDEPPRPAPARLVAPSSSGNPEGIRDGIPRKGPHETAPQTAAERTGSGTPQRPSPANRSAGMRSASTDRKPSLRPPQETPCEPVPAALPLQHQHPSLIVLQAPSDRSGGLRRGSASQPLVSRAPPPLPAVSEWREMRASRIAQAQDSASSGSDQDDETEEDNGWSPQRDRGASGSGPLATPGPALAVEPGVSSRQRYESTPIPLTIQRRRSSTHGEEEEEEEDEDEEEETVAPHPRSAILNFLGHRRSRDTG